MSEIESRFNCASCGKSYRWKPELAGKKAVYQVNIKEVKQEILPELDDEFISSLDEEGVDTVDQLDARIREDLRKNADRVATESYHNEIIDLLMATATLDYPDVLVNREIDRTIDRESNHASHSPEGLANWLNTIGQTEESVREMFREQADLTVRRALVLGELIDAEKIEVSEEAIDEEVDSLVSQMMGAAAQNQEAIRNLFDTPDGRSSIRSQLLTRFAIERLEAICSSPEAEESATPQRTSRRRRSGAADGDTSEAGDAEASADTADDAAEATDETAE